MKSLTAQVFHDQDYRMLTDVDVEQFSPQIIDVVCGELQLLVEHDVDPMMYQSWYVAESLAPSIGSPKKRTSEYRAKHPWLRSHGTPPPQT